MKHQEAAKCLEPTRACERFCLLLPRSAQLCVIRGDAELWRLRMSSPRPTTRLLAKCPECGLIHWRQEGGREGLHVDLVTDLTRVL